MERQDKTTLSAHFPDAEDARRVLDAAGVSGKTPSAFIRDAALAEVARLGNRCPACGRPHAKKRRAA